MQRRVEVTVVIRALFLFAVVLGIDQSIKAIAQTYPAFWHGTFFRFTENSGIAFSMPLAGAWLWAGVSVAFICIVVFACRAAMHHDRRTLFSLVLLLAGGVGNILDRFRFGAVTDIFVLPGGLLFNIADCAIVLGVITLLFSSRRRY